MLNQLRSVELKFRVQSTTLGKKERADMAAKLREAQAASQITNIRDSLMSGAGLETQQYTERIAALREFYQGRQDLAAEYNSLMDAQRTTGINSRSRRSTSNSRTCGSTRS